MRVILYTGKGGVGKTSIAACTAAHIAARGKRVLIVSTDEAHSLSDSFDIKLGNSPKEIAENLYGMEIDTVIENEMAWGNIKAYFKQLLTLKAKDGIETEELLVFPGLGELLSLIKIKEIYDDGLYDVLIVDCAPTGETMSLLKFPDVFRWWMEKLFPMKRKAAKLAGPIVESTTKIPMPKDDVFVEMEKLYTKIDELHGLMMDKKVVSIRIVTTPEKIVIKEAKRSFSYLHLYDYNVDAIIINKIFPKDSMEGYFNAWIKLQEQSLNDIEESFKGLPVFKVGLMDKELRCYSMLEQVGSQIYKEHLPEDILFQDKIFEVQKLQEGYSLNIHIPFVDKKELKLSQQGDELTLTIKNEKRSFTLPQKLRNHEISTAKYEDNQLKIYYLPQNQD